MRRGAVCTLALLALPCRLADRHEDGFCRYKPFRLTSVSTEFESICTRAATETGSCSSIAPRCWRWVALLLSAATMRERHWKLLMTVTGVEFEMGADFSLAHLTALQLHKFVDDVGEVVDRAVKEDKMEQTLAKLKVTWAVVEFEFDQHRDTDVFLMKMKEEDFETLEDNQLVVQGMMASKYLATFEEEVTGWQKKLGNVSDVLAQMSEVQRKWAYLETLFIGSDEVKKELPESTERFVGIDKTFKECLGAIYKIKNAVAATDVEGQQKTLEIMANDLELCEKDLADFLESKRRIFPYAIAILHLSSPCRCLCLTLRAHSHSLTLCLTHTHTLTLSHTLSHSLSLSHSHSLTHSHSHSLTLSRARAPSTDASTSWPPRTCWTCFPMATGRGWSWGTSTTSCRASSR